MILQNRITANQGRVEMGAIAKIPQVDTHAPAGMVTLGTTAIVSLIATMYIQICFSNLLRLAKSYIIVVNYKHTISYSSIYEKQLHYAYVIIEPLKESWDKILKLPLMCK